MSQPNFPTQGFTPQEPPSAWANLKMPLLFGGLIALIIANVYLFTQIDSLRQQVQKNNDLLISELAKVKETGSVQVAAAKRNLEALQGDLEAARRQAAMAVGQAKVDAEKKVEETARKLEQQQRAVEQAVRSEIKQVETAAAATATRVGEVSTEVTGVKGDLSTTKAELDKTIAALKSVQGDMGVQSGLVATNSKEIAALRALGDRNIFEFTLGKTKQPQRVGDVMLQLSKVDLKRNRYTVNVTADDKRVEKKDKGINEPVQFYTSKARVPYEIVVNELRKDTIVGYLSTPKVQSAR